VPLPARLSEAVVTTPHDPGERTVLYLHGFASSARSTKAGYFAERLRDYPVTFESPDFNEPDFATMTMTRMVDQLGAVLSRVSDRAVLMGSSLGGTLAILAAARFAPKIDRVVLLAPAVMFAKAGHHLLPPERIDEWQRRGALPFFHYAYEEERLLSYSFYEDSLQHDAFNATFTQPTLVFQGLRDASVDYRTVEAFARDRPNVTLSLLDDDHQLIASLPRIWESVADFLGLAE
jgi:pimeloyl-ACP methyl ester carboxylesterase